MFRNFWSVKALFITTIATLVFFFGMLVLGFYGIPRIINSQIEKQTELTEGTDQWDRFEKLPFPLEFKVWFWVVNNDQEILKGAQPNLTEQGPYVYLQHRSKTILEKNAAEDSVSYEQHMEMVFNASLSGEGLSEDDEVMVVNPVYMSAIQMTSAIERMALFGCLEKLFPPDFNGIFIKQKVKTLLFDGYVFAKRSEEVGVACEIIRQKMIALVEPVKVIEANKDENGEVESLKLAYFDFKVRQPDGKYTVNRGRTHTHQLGNIMRWNDKDQLGLWGRTQSVNNETCNKVRGTDATIYPPGISKDDLLEIYSTDICRFVSIYYSGEDSYNGISAYRYETSKDTFRPATEKAENDCYCSKASKDENGDKSCFLDGVFDFKPCLGAPVLVSFPHFLYADKKYLDGVIGMNPDEKIHKIHLLVEPNTGTPLEGKKRVQLNSVLRPESFIPTSTNLPNVVIPLLWLEEGVSLPQNYVDLLNDQFFSKVKLATGLKYGLIAASAAACLLSTVFLVRKKFFTVTEKV